MEILSRLGALFGQPCETIDVIESFCGVAEIVQAFTNAGFAACGYDYAFDARFNNLCTIEGFTHCLWLRLRFRCTGLAWFATVCSTWIWMSRSSTERSPTQPLGCVYAGNTVEQGNIQVARCSLLMLLIAFKGGLWMLEQPLGSIMKHHPSLKWLRSLTNHYDFMSWYEQHSCMAAFESDTVKPSWFCGNNHGMVRALARQKPLDFKATNLDTVRKDKAPDGRLQVTGGPGLKQTQAYTPSFATAVLDNYIFFAPSHVEPVDDELHMLPEADVWESAALAGVLEHLVKIE